MICQICPKKATVLCCSTNLCGSHFTQHFALRMTHQPQQLLFKLPPADQSILNIQLQNRISALKNLKSKLNSYSNSLIQRIENLQSALINEINKTISSYQEILQTQYFEDLKIPEKILETQMKVKKINPKSLISKINKMYPKDLLRFEIDLDKKRTLIKNKFLQTHSGEIYCLAISNDGKFIVTGSKDASLRVWDFDERKLVACYYGHTSYVNCVIVSSDSGFVVSGSNDRLLIVWDLKMHCLRKVLGGHTGSIQSVALSLDEKLLISGSYDCEIRVWSMGDFGLVKVIKTQKQVCSLLFISNNKFALGEILKINICDINSFSISQSIIAHNFAINSISKTSNNIYLITGSDDETVKIWNLHSLSLHGTLKGHSDFVNSVCVTSDDSKIISSSNNSRIIIWSINSLSKIHQITHENKLLKGVKSFKDSIISIIGHEKIGITRQPLSKFESYLELKNFTFGSEQQKEDLIAYGILNTVIIWSINESEIKLEGHNGNVFKVCFYNNGKRLVSASQGKNKNLIVWDLQKKTVLSCLKGHSCPVNCLDVSCDDCALMSGDDEARVLFWDLTGMRLVCEFKGHSESVYCVKFTKSKKFAASAGFDEKVIVWDIEKRTQHAVLFGHKGCVKMISITNDDEFVVSANFHEGVRVWSIRDKRQIFEFRKLEESRAWLDNNPEKRAEISRFLL